MPITPSHPPPAAAPDAVVHVILDPSRVDEVLGRARRGDAIVDLTWEMLGIGGELTERAPAGAEVLAIDTASEAMFTRASVEVLDWIATLSKARIGPAGEDLPELLRYDDRVSMWWFTGLTVKEIVKSHVHRCMLRIVALDEAARGDQRGHAAIERMRSANRIVVWSDHAASADLIARAISTTAEIPRERVEARGPRLALRARARRRLAGLEGWARVARNLALGVVHGETTFPGRERARAPIDVVVLTTPLLWSREIGDDGRPRLVSRYFGDLPRELAAAGLRTCVLPACAGGRSLEWFRDQCRDTGGPIDWSALRYSRSTPLRVARRLATVRRRALAVIPLLAGHPALRFRGVDVADWIAREIEINVGDAGYQNAFLYETTRESLASLAPRLVIYMEEFYQSGRAIAAASPEGVPRLALQHALVQRDHLTYRFTPAWRELISPEGARAEPARLAAPDRFLGYGPYVAELLAEGFGAERVASVGSLRHEALLPPRRPTATAKRLARAKLGIPEDVGVLLVTAQLMRHLHPWLRWSIQALRSRREPWYLAVKLHWQSRAASEVEGWIRQLGWEPAGVFESSLDELFVASDVVCTGTSTTGIEGALRDRPLICFGDPERYEPFEYVSGGLAQPAWSGPSMVRALDGVTDPRYLEPWRARRDAFVARHLAPEPSPRAALLRLVGEQAGAERLTPDDVHARRDHVSDRASQRATSEIT
jgi:hypothetical protein